jgi:hypothetical protein
MKARASIIVALFALIGTQLAGCDAPASRKPLTLVTGLIDTNTIFDSDPEYAALSKQYITERVAMGKNYVKATTGKKADGVAELQMVYNDRQKELDKKWMDKTNDFVKSRRAKLEEATGAICRDKGIDMVIVDSTRYRTVEFGGIDITQDVMAKLYGPKPNPIVSASPADGKEKK